MGRDDYSSEHIKFNSRVESEKQMASAGFGLDKLVKSKEKILKEKGVPFIVNMKDFKAKHKHLFPKQRPVIKGKRKQGLVLKDKKNSGCKRARKG